MKDLPVIVLSDDDSDAPVRIKRRRLVKNGAIVKKNNVQAHALGVEGSDMSYQKTPTLSSNNYKKNVGVGGSGSFGGSSDGTPKTTNKRKANEIRAMISTNIAPLIDFSIRKRGRASQPMTPG
ncbi:hypothetical protein Tco_1181664 [Tanacetum coccineum]